MKVSKSKLQNFNEAIIDNNIYYIDLDIEAERMAADESIEGVDRQHEIISIIAAQNGLLS